MGIPVVVTVALAAADDDGVAVSQTVPAAGTLALSGALTSGSSANNVCTTQSLGGAGNLTLNGSTVTGGVAYLYGQAVQIISAGNDTSRTFTVKGIATDGVSYVQETVTGSNTSRVATTTLFYTVTSIAVSGATGGNVTVGTNGLATLTSAGQARQVLLTFGTDDSANSYTITGTNANGQPLSEVVAGGATTSTSTNHFRTVTRITSAGASAGTVKVGTNGVGSSCFVSMSYHAQPVNISAAAVVSGTVNYTLQWTYDDPNVSTPTWFAASDVTSQTGNKVGVMNDPVFGGRVLMNSSTAPGYVTTTFIEAGLRG